MTPRQLQSLHITRQKLEKLSLGECDRAWFDLVLINLGHVDPSRHGGEVSSKYLTNSGFERVMAFLEESLAKIDPKTGTYWRDRDRRRGHFLSSRQEWEIGRLYPLMQEAGATYSLAGLVFNFTNRRTQHAHEMNPSEAQKLIEMMKAVIARQPHQEVQSAH